MSDAIAQAVAAERERCAKIAYDWIATFGHVKVEFVDAQHWATDAVKDIAAAIRDPKGA